MHQRVSEPNYRDYLKKLNDSDLVIEITEFLKTNSSAPNFREMQEALKRFDDELDQSKKVLKRNGLISHFLIFITNANNSKKVVNIEAVDEFLYKILDDLEKDGPLCKYPFFKQFIEPVFLGIISVYEAIEPSKRANFFRYTLDVLAESFKNPSNIRVHFLPLELAEFISTISANFKLEENNLLNFISAYEMFNQVYSFLDITKALKSAGIGRAEEGEVQKLTFDISMLIKEIFEKLALKYDDPEGKFYDSLNHSLMKKEWLKLLPSEEKMPEEMDPDHLEGLAITEHLIVLLTNARRLGSIIRDRDDADDVVSKAETDFENNWNDICAIIFDYDKARKIIWFDEPRGLNLLWEFKHETYKKSDFELLRDYLIVTQVIIAIQRNDYELLEEVQNAAMSSVGHESPIFRSFFVKDLSNFVILEGLNNSVALKLRDIFFKTFDCETFDEISSIIDSFLYELYFLRVLQNLNQRNLTQAFDDLILKSKFVLENNGDLQKFSWSICSNVAARFYDSGSSVRDLEDIFWNNSEKFSTLFPDDHANLGHIAREVCPLFTLAQLLELRDKDLKALLSSENLDVLKAYGKKKEKLLPNIIEFGFTALKTGLKIKEYLKIDLEFILEAIKTFTPVQLEFLSSQVSIVAYRIGISQEFEGDNDILKLINFYKRNENKLSLLLCVEETYGKENGFSKAVVERNLKFLLSSDCSREFIEILINKENIQFFNLLKVLGANFLHGLYSRDIDRLSVLKREDFSMVLATVDSPQNSRKQERINKKSEFINAFFIAGRSVHDAHLVLNYIVWTIDNFDQVDLFKLIKSINENHASYMIFLNLMNSEAKGFNINFAAAISFVVHLKRELNYSIEEIVEAWKLVEWMRQKFPDLNLGLFLKKMQSDREALDRIKKAQVINFDKDWKFSEFMAILRNPTFKSICDLATRFFEETDCKLSFDSIAQVYKYLIGQGIPIIAETEFAQELSFFLDEILELNLRDEFKEFCKVNMEGLGLVKAINLLIDSSDEALYVLMNKNILSLAQRESYSRIHSVCTKAGNDEFVKFLTSQKCSILLGLDYGYKRICNFFKLNEAFLKNISDEDFEKVMRGIKEVMLAIKFLKSGKRVKIGTYETAILKAANDNYEIVEQSTALSAISQQLSEFMFSSEDLKSCVLIPNEIKAIMLANLRLDSTYISQSESANDLAI